MSVTQKHSTVVGRRYLTDGEHSGETDPTYVIYSLTRVDWYPWWQRGRTEATSSPAMAAQRRCAEVRQPLHAMPRLHEKCMSSMVTTWI